MEEFCAKFLDWLMDVSRGLCNNIDSYLTLFAMAYSTRPGCNIRPPTVQFKSLY